MEIDIKIKNIKDKDINQLTQVLNDLVFNILKEAKDTIKYDVNNFFIRNNYHYEITAIGENGK